ncbi:MAG: tetratricopeptide repeat protein [Myxococcales bacterium]|nr:tetratricopeptide repeat protein [Myxococcales bacterium]
MSGSQCPTCGFPNPRAFKSCAQCGTVLEADRAPTGAIAVQESRRTSRPPPDEAEQGAFNASRSDRARAGRPPSDSPSGSRKRPTLEVRLQAASTDPEAAKQSPLIGQEAVVRPMDKGLRHAFTASAPTLIAIAGGRGSGKTRLLEYAAELAASASPGTRLLYGGVRRRQTSAYAPFDTMILELLDSGQSDGAAEIRSKLGAAARRRAPEPDEARAMAHLLGHVIGVPFPNSPVVVPLEGNPTELHRRSCAAVRDFLVGGATQSVTVLLDNMDHASELSWGVVEALVEQPGPICVLTSGDRAVFERAQRIEPKGGVLTLPIAPFGPDDVAELLRRTVPGLAEVPDAIASAIAHRSGGNPAAAREIIYALWERNVFVEQRDHLVIDPQVLELDQLPVSLTDAIRGRLARQDPLVRATLERAAVVGEIFWDGAVVAQMRVERGAPRGVVDPLAIWANDEDAASVEGALERLRAQGFVEPLESPELPGAREWRFVNARTQQVVYQAIPEFLRSERHAATAKWLAMLDRAMHPRMAALIAPHLELAGETAQAGRAYLDAASFEESQARAHAALQLLVRAIRLIPASDVVAQMDALHRHGSALVTLGDYHQAIESFTAMLRHAWSIGARGKGGAALNRIGRIYRARGEYERAKQFFERALTLFRGAEDLRGVAATLDDMAQLELHGTRADLARGWLEEALEIRRAHGDHRGEALSLTTLGRLELQRGDLETAHRLGARALQLRLQLADAKGILDSYAMLGEIAYERGDQSGAIQAWQSALEQAAQIGDRGAECSLLAKVGRCLLDSDNLDAAARPLKRAQDLAADLGDRRVTADVAHSVALLALHRGEKNAMQQLLEAIDLAEAYGGRDARARAHRSLGQVLARTAARDGEVDPRAEEHLTTSVRLFQESGNEKDAARTLADLGAAIAQRGDVATARQHLTHAARALRAMRLPEHRDVEAQLKQLP